MKTAIIIMAAIATTSCGTTRSDRAITGAMIGGGIGLATGGIGIAVGAILGAGAGYVMTPSQINLGEPVWKQ